MAQMLAKQARLAVRLCVVGRQLPAISQRRTTTNDFCSNSLGAREIVGYGVNGSPCYADRLDFPIPGIRFREPTKLICLLREKERCDWKKLTIDEKKELYRYSFCQTYSEMKAFTPDWKLVVGIMFWTATISCLISYSYALFLYGPLPDTFDEPRRQAQLKRMIAMEVNPVQGLTSKWDYDKKTWKK